ncbi:MAG: hypothetical protein P1P85_02855 [Patescibacteria group bacterium]|nr:hypothetical protein [Patescibacteria group bacterium]
MDIIKQITKIRYGIASLFVKLGIIEIKETKVECNVMEVEEGVYEIEIGVE